MKNILFLISVALWSYSAGAQPVEKETFLYAVKGSDTLRLDRYRTTDFASPAPCLIFAFGGGFSGGERDAASYLSFFDYMVRRGYQVVSIDYRLGMKGATSEELSSPDLFMSRLLNTLFMATEDLYTATGYVLQHAKHWGIDPARIVACGSSAGAITVLQGEYGICNGSESAVQILPQDFNYAGVISLAGAIFNMGENLVWKLAPAPMMLFHGDADANVPYDAVRMGDAGFFGSAYIARQLTEMAKPHYFYSVTNAAHEIATDPMEMNRFEIDAFLDKLVLNKLPLIIDTREDAVGREDRKKEFTIEDFIRSNYAK